jgi:hypothetical protein
MNESKLSRRGLLKALGAASAAAATLSSTLFGQEPGGDAPQSGRGQGGRAPATFNGPPPRHQQQLRAANHCLRSIRSRCSGQAMRKPLT